METLRIKKHEIDNIGLYTVVDIKKLFKAIDDQHPELEVKENCMYMESNYRDGHLEHYFKDSFTRRGKWLRLYDYQYEEINNES